MNIVGWLTDRDEFYFDKDEAMRNSDGFIRPLCYADSAKISDEEIGCVWSAAITCACNFLVSAANRHDENDETDERNCLNWQAQKLQDWLLIDDVYLAEVREIINDNMR